jgi:hypothetical protein
MPGQGAPEKIIDRCTHHLHNGQEVPIDTQFRMEFEAAYERFGFAGERVLGFAYKEFRGRDKAVYKRDESSYPTTGLVFAGLISLVDPPKPGVEEAIGECRDAFIRVVMVTGDHPLTAEAIARKVTDRQMYRGAGRLVRLLLCSREILKRPTPTLPFPFRSASSRCPLLAKSQRKTEKRRPRFRSLTRASKPRLSQVRSAFLTRPCRATSHSTLVQISRDGCMLNAPPSPSLPRLQAAPSPSSPRRSGTACAEKTK